MKKQFIFYIDMDGVLNLFESDKNARVNMWTPGYFRTIPVRPGISNLLVRINAIAYVVILSKVINRIGVTQEKSFWTNDNISPDAYSDIIYVPYDRSKADYLYPGYPCMLVDDKESNLIECKEKGCHGLFLSDIKTTDKFPVAENLDDIWNFFKNLIDQYDSIHD